jgi:methyltransferase (TIGR00027 family)
MTDQPAPEPAASAAAREARPVGMTARWIAAARAHETARPNPLFNDPFAARLAADTELGAEIGEAWSAGASTVDDLIVATTRIFGAPILAVRTRFFDELLLRAVRVGRVRQVVLLAAGLDARAYRLPWPPGTHVYELDQSAVLTAKARTMERLGAEPSCQRCAVPVDLAVPGWEKDLCAAGYDMQAPSAWLAEGLLMYLERSAVQTLLATTARLAAPGSWLGADVFSTAVLTAPLLRPLVALMSAQGAPWHFASDDPVALFRDAGWTATATDVEDAAARYGRWPFLRPFRLRGTPRYYLIEARLNGGAEHR